MKVIVKDSSLYTFAKRQLPGECETQLAEKLSELSHIFVAPGQDKFEKFSTSFNTRRYSLNMNSDGDRIITDLRYSSVGNILRVVNGKYSSAHLDYYLAVLFPIMLARIASDQGLMPYHSTVISYDNQNVMFLGGPGSGKTSIAWLANRYGGEIQSDNFTLFSGLEYYGIRSPLRFDQIIDLQNQPLLQVKPSLFEVSFGENQFTKGKISKVIYLSRGVEYRTQSLSPSFIPQFIWRDALLAPEYRLLLEVLNRCNFANTFSHMQQAVDFEFEMKELPGGAFKQDMENKTWHYLF